MKKISSAIIGFGIGQKHFEAIHKYKNSEVNIICEKNRFKLRKRQGPLLSNDDVLGMKMQI